MDDQSLPSPSEINSELLFLLRAINPNWERIRYLFDLLRKTDPLLIPAQLIQKLGIYYLQCLSQNETVDPDAVLSCLLNFQAHGFPIPEYLRRTFDVWMEAQPYKKSPFPQQLKWSTPALMQNDSTASMDSPIIHVWIYTDEKDSPIEIIVCGQGVGWIKEQIDNLVLSTALQLSAKSADVLLDGFMCLRLTPDEINQSRKGGKAESVISPEAFLTGGKNLRKNSLEHDVSPVEAMRDLEIELTQLEAKTGLVIVNRCSNRLRSEYFQSINEKTQEYKDERAVIWKYSGSEANRVIIPYPIHRLNLDLPLSLIESPEFRSLHNSYQNNLLSIAASDALRRFNFYTNKLTDHVNELKKFVDPKTRASLPETVQIVLLIDFETGLSYRAKEPQEVVRDEYYGKILPNLIRTDIQWIRKIKKLLGSLATAISKLDSNLNRLTIARLFDAALRDLTIYGSPEVIDAFDKWKKKVQPFLWQQWAINLEKYALHDGAYSTRQLFFMMDIDVGEKYFTMKPFLLADTNTTLFVFDSQYPHPLLYSLNDKLTEKDFNPQTEKAYQAITEWENQIKNDHDDDVGNLLQSALSYDPDVTLREILNAHQKPFVPVSLFEKNIGVTKLKTFPILSHNLAIRLFSHNALQSSFDVLVQASEQLMKEPPDSPFRNLVDIPLTLAWLKALMEFGKNTPTKIGQLRNGYAGNDAEREIQRHLRFALQLDSEHVNRCVDKKELLISKQLRKLSSHSYLNAYEQTVFNILRALSFVQAARSMALGVEELELSGESPRSVYAKIAPSINEIWSNYFIQDTSDQLDDLMSMLLGFDTTG